MRLTLKITYTGKNESDFLKLPGVEAVVTDFRGRLSLLGRHLALNPLNLRVGDSVAVEL